MRNEGLLTTGDIATHCRVSYEAVSKWIKSGKLKAYTTPGRHHRVRRADFEDFLREYNLPPLTPPEPRRKVLLVDDDPTVLRLLSTYFAIKGQYEIATAVDGFEASIQIAGNPPDLVILDLMMPNIDGFKVCKGVRANPKTRRTLVVVLTGFATPENVRKAMECGADCCLGKPVSLGDLEQKLAELWAGAAAHHRRAHA
ncbi:MAG: response regulator [Candidatus Handelsmanbacteria bacterium]|nr:response regulator [Candidatus Handelsmanbacteria bacterium]